MDPCSNHIVEFFKVNSLNSEFRSKPYIVVDEAVKKLYRILSLTYSATEVT